MALIATVIDESTELSLVQLCRVSDAAPDQIHALMAEGVLAPSAGHADDHRFNGIAVARARLAVRLSRDFDLGPEGVALVMELIDQLDELRSQLRRRGA